MRVGVLAVGNRFAGDDAVGPLVLDAVRDHLPVDVAAVELDGEPARILAAWDDLEAVVVVDAAHSGAPVGSVHRLVVHPEHLEAVMRPSGPAAGTHGAGVAEALGLGRALGRVPTAVVVVAVEGRRYAAGDPCSEEVVAAINEAAALVRDEVVRLTAVAA